MRGMQILGLTALVLVGGCGLFGGGKKEPGVDPETFKAVVTVAKGVRADPAKADEVLKESGLTRAQLEDALYEIAADPQLSERYAKAIKGDR